VPSALAIYMELTTAGRRRPEGKGYDPFQQFLVENGMNAGMLGSGSYIRTHYFFSERVDAETSGMLDRAPGALPV
jgi:hypothetical protein